MHVHAIPFAFSAANKKMSVLYTCGPNGEESVRIAINGHAIALNTQTRTAAMNMPIPAEAMYNEFQRRFEYMESMVGMMARFLGPIVAERAATICQTFSTSEAMPNTFRCLPLLQHETPESAENLRYFVEHLLMLAPAPENAAFFSALHAEIDEFRNATIRSGIN